MEVQQGSCIRRHQIVGISRCKVIDGFIKVKLQMRSHQEGGGVCEFPHGTMWLSMNQVDEEIYDLVREHIVVHDFESVTNE